MTEAADFLSKLSATILDRMNREGLYPGTASWTRIEIDHRGELVVREIDPSEIYLAPAPPHKPSQE